MAQVIFNEEWIVEARLSERTGLSERQVKSYRQGSWVEGVHFKRIPQVEGVSKDRAVIWYNLPKINQLVQDA